MSSVSPPFFQALKDAMEKLNYETTSRHRKQVAEFLDGYEWLDVEYTGVREAGRP